MIFINSRGGTNDYFRRASEHALPRFFRDAHFLFVRAFEFVGVQPDVDCIPLKVVFVEMVFADAFAEGLSMEGVSSLRSALPGYLLSRMI